MHCPGPLALRLQTLTGRGRRSRILPCLAGTIPVPSRLFLTVYEPNDSIDPDTSASGTLPPPLPPRVYTEASIGTVGSVRGIVPATINELER